MKIRTFKIDRLYHQFLKPKNISLEQLPFLVSKLYEHKFIDLYHDPEDPDVERYAETEKLTSRLYRDQLFRIVQELK